MNNRAAINGQVKGFSALAYVGIMVGVLLAIVKALIWSKGAFTSEVFGYALAGAVIAAPLPTL
jgi:hypothetical protein